MNAFPDEEHDFESDSLRNQKPVKFLKDGGDVLIYRLIEQIDGNES